MNLLYYGDNLDVLRRHVKDESVDLVYLDPPFKSNQDYNVLFAERGTKAAAQIKAFEDTWEWDEAAALACQEIIEAGGPVSEVMRAFRTFLGTSDMMAYLAMMAPRLVELRRVMKLDGSIYLHCDPTAGHYLKILMDAVFGPTLFLNEIVWKRTGAHGAAKRYGPVHDLLLFYARGDSYVWNKQYQAQDDYVAERYTYEDPDGKRFYPITLHAAGVRHGESGKPWRGIDITAKGGHWKYGIAKLDELDAEGRIYWPEHGTMPRLKVYADEAKGAALQDVWTDIPPVNARAAERLGYPTQKPLALLERIILASSNEGDTVLDPFCGCGTTIAAAHKLGRNWVGIDVTHLAIGLIKHRLADAYGTGVEKTYEVHGEPQDLAGARQLAEDDKHEFQAWALGLVNARRDSSGRKGPDKGIDGRLAFHDEGATGKTKDIIFSVKGGNLKATDLRDLRGVLDREQATIGVLISLEEPSGPMRKEAATGGYYTSPWDNGRYPRLQLRTIKELLGGHGIEYPAKVQTNVTYQRAPRSESVEPQTRMLAFDATEEPGIPMDGPTARRPKRRR